MSVCAVKFDEIVHDYDIENDHYERAVQRQYDNSLRLWQHQPEDQEEVIYKRNMHKSFNRALIRYLIDAGGISMEAREAIACLEDSIGGGRNRKKVEFPERIYLWLREQRPHIEAYLNGKYADEVHRLFD